MSQLNDVVVVDEDVVILLLVLASVSLVKSACIILASC